MKLEFQKFCGAGNDFIIIDNRNFKQTIKNRADFAVKYCRRGLSIGADGVIFIENSSISDFKMSLFQPDGSQAEMCGNGGRCSAKYAYLNGITNKEMKFETPAGLIEAYIFDKSVSVKLTQPTGLKLNSSVKLDGLNLSFDYGFINTGVPHTVIIADNPENIDVKNLGNKIRFHKDFQPAGTNVNFIKFNEDNSISIRTYERGVEDETLACGTGSTASALIASLKKGLESPVSVKTKSGLILKIHFDRKNLINGNFAELNLFLEGDAEKIYDGIVEVMDDFI
ncbi:MAG TPA: diaminopimelate epimerase [bacterium]|nr:diaminopimelate epimerase [bacterium]HPN29876.1 diaminopimelate epimerase [bacterium]